MSELNKIQSFFTYAPNLIAIINSDGYFIFANEAWEQSLHYTAKELYQMNYIDLIHSDEQQFVRSFLNGENLAVLNFENRCRTKEGTYIWLRWSVRINPKTNCIYAIVQNVTDLKLNFLYGYDRLTGLPNRSLFQQQFEERFLNLAPKSALIICDLDHLRRINNVFGHTVGDQIILSISQQLANWIEPTDLLGRLDGDEFVIILKSINNKADVEKKVQELQKMITTAHLPPPQDHLLVTVSAGIALYPDDGDTLQDLFQCADLALHTAKKHARNYYRFYTPELNSKAEKHLSLAYDLQQAFEQNQLEIYYQTQVDIRTSEIVGMEALLRWKKNGAFLSTIEFIKVAEETGQIIPIGAWVLEQATKQIYAWNKQYQLNLSIAVNVSPRQFSSPHFLELIKQALLKSKLKPSLLELEITESILADQEYGVDNLLKKIKQLDVRITLDDFGTGYSSLNYLQRFPIDKIKIDRSFINDIEFHPRQKAITQAILNLATAFNMQVIAEGVETEAQYHILKNISCHLIQGFWHSKPLPPDQVMSMLEHNSN